MKVQRLDTALYPKYHPGDIYALGQEIVLVEYKGNSIYLTENILTPKIFWNECKNKCEKECLPEFTCNNNPPMSEEYKSCKQKYEQVFRQCNAECPYICMDEKYKSVSVSRHIEGGYYSDGSYYEHDLPFIGHITSNYFKNVHPKKEEYEKTKWQKDRDECMKLTYENVKDSVEYYQNCLKERGYDIK